MGLLSTRVVIIEDQVIFRELLAEVLRASLSLEIAAQFSEGKTALQALESLPCDLVILDAVLPDVNGLDVLEKLIQRRRSLPVIMVTAHARPALVQAAVKLGARGFITKGTPLQELNEGVRRVLAGGSYFCSVTSTLLTDAVRWRNADGELTPRQREIVQLVARGLSSKEIASELGISLKTVANHRFQIREKLDVNDVASLTRYAIEHGLVEPKV